MRPPPAPVPPSVSPQCCRRTAASLTAPRSTAATPRPAPQAARRHWLPAADLPRPIGPRTRPSRQPAPTVSHTAQLGLRLPRPIPPPPSHHWPPIAPFLRSLVRVHIHHDYPHRVAEIPTASLRRCRHWPLTSRFHGTTGPSARQSAPVPFRRASRVTRNPAHCPNTPRALARPLPIAIGHRCRFSQASGPPARRSHPS